MKNANLFFRAFLLFVASNTNAQVGIGTTTPATSAALEIASTNTGFLPPRITKVARDGITAPVAGLMIWCIDCGPLGEIEVFNGSNWTNLLGGLPAGIAIGDNAGGGILAYILQPGDPGYVPWEIHGLIATPSDQSTGAEWGCSGVDITGADGTALGTGNQNTVDIITGCMTPGIAAPICSDLVLNGYSDWYLPSIDELNKLYLNKTAIGGFADVYYWSSTEANATFSWRQDFVSGSQGTSLRSTPRSVRAIRSF